MDRNVNPENESKSGPILRAYLVRDILVIDNDCRVVLIPKGPLQEVKLVITDENGVELWTESLWK
jgi:hypothetical protein